MGLGYFILLRKYTRLWQAITPSSDITPKIRVSILIAFRNEARNLPALIRSLNAQTLPVEQVEVVLINDASDDQGERIISEHPLKYNHKVVQSEGAGKKNAIRTAWKYATGDVIVHTDADCIHNEQWLAHLILAFSDEQVQMVSGPVDFVEHNGFFHDLVRLDFVALIAIGASHIQWTRPMLCNGANLAYRAKWVEKLNLNDNKASGDDVFLMQSIHQQGGKVHFERSKQAIVTTEPPKDIEHFMAQRLRWASKNGSYNSSFNTAILVFVWLYNVAIVFGLLTFNSLGMTIAAFLISVKWLAEEQFYTKFASFFGIRRWAVDHILGQIFHILYMALLPPLSQLMSYQWKGRKLK